MSGITEKESFEERLRVVEDRLDIYQIISVYGPAADSGSLTEAADLWTEDGVYDIPGIGSFYGRTDIIKLLGGELHQSLIAGGSAHVMSMPHVRINGNTAVAINYANVYVPRGEEFGIFRVVASRWEMVRQGDSWKINRRTNHLLDGRAEARQLLAETTERL